MEKPSTQTAMQAIEVYLSAVDRPEALRVTKTGRLELASGASVLFNRLAHAVNPRKNIDEITGRWKEKARDTIVQKLITELALFTDTVSRRDSEVLDEALKRITDTNGKDNKVNWRDQFFREIVELDTKKGTASLTASIKNISSLNKPENAALYPYVRKQLRAGNNFSEGLEMGLRNFLVKKNGMPLSNARNAAKTMHHLMITYDSPVEEAFFIASRAGQMVLKNELGGQKISPLPLAYLQIHHGLTLEAAINIYKNVEKEDQTVANARETISVMQIYNVAFNEADAIVALAGSLHSANPKEVSKAQQIEIAWLRLHSNKDPDQAKLISLQAGRIHGRIPPNREAHLDVANTEVNQEIANVISQALPAGWPDAWELMPDGSRQLTNTANFETQFMDFFQGSLSDCKVNEKRGLADKFLVDVGRSNFQFDHGDRTITVRTDPIKAIAAFESFAPDRMVRQTLSKALFQAGGNGLEYAMGLGLASPGKNYFSIFSFDPDNKAKNAPRDYWISLQHTEDGKVRVGYSLYMKHFTLMNSNTGDLLPINSRKSSKPATYKDHTASAIAVIEFDYAQLSKGTLEPNWVRPPELRLTIEPDREGLIKRMVENKLKKLRFL